MNTGKENLSLKYNNSILIEKLHSKSITENTFENVSSPCFIYYLKSNVNTKKPFEIFLNCQNCTYPILNNQNNIEEIIVIHLDQEILKNIFKEEIFENYIHTIKTTQTISSDYKNIEQYISNIEFYLDYPNSITNELLELKIKELLLLLILNGEQDSISALFNQIYSNREYKIRQVVESNLYNDIGLDELARYANLSISTFKKQFQTIYQDTPASYIRKKKLERAISLIQTSNMSIKEIAFLSGFNDDSYFSKLFKKIYGHSPSNLRDHKL